MRDHLILWAIPFFLTTLSLEALFDRRHGSPYYTRRDTWTNLALGTISVLFGAVWGGINLWIYGMFHAIAPFNIQPCWWSWILVILLDDFFYYWFHRVSHERRFFWNFHVVHHSSDHYNLSVALRQSGFGAIAAWVFYVPIVALGFPIWMVLAAHSINLLYQYWIHTQYIISLGPLEYILNTPAHHRVHHGVNDKYLDRNYAGILIIWDRLFGTFVQEEETPRYGIIKPVKSHNPLWLNLHGWAEMFAAMKTRKTLWGKLRCVWGAPAMDHAESPALATRNAA